MDLKYISAHPAQVTTPRFGSLSLVVTWQQADELQQSVEQLLGRILAFPLPTIAGAQLDTSADPLTLTV